MYITAIHGESLIKEINYNNCEADNECCSCGCEFDLLYKRALEFLA